MINLFLLFFSPSHANRAKLISHELNLQVEIKRTIPKGVAPLKDFKTRKIFVGGIPITLTEGDASLFCCIYHSHSTIHAGSNRA